MNVKHLDPLVNHELKVIRKKSNFRDLESLLKIDNAP